MIRVLASNPDRMVVMLGLEPVNLDRLREGQPIRVNLRHLVPGEPPCTDDNGHLLPDIDVVIFFGGQEETRMLTEAFGAYDKETEP